MEEITIKIGDGGRLAFIYSDAVADLLTLGRATVARASHVEPTPFGDGTVGWGAVMVADGVFLGPFRTRAEALAAETAHLQRTQGL